MKNNSDDFRAVALIVARAAERIRRQQHADVDYSQLSDGFPLTDEKAKLRAGRLGPEISFFPDGKINSLSWKPIESEPFPLPLPGAGSGKRLEAC